MAFFLRSKVHDLERRCTTLEGQLRSLKLEWEDVQDKVYRWMQRARKRVEREESKTNEAAEENWWTEEHKALDPISAAILTERKRGL